MLALLWLTGSVAAIGVAWAGVSIVDGNIIDPAPARSLPGADSEAIEDQTVTSSAATGETQGQQGSGAGAAASGPSLGGGSPTEPGQGPTASNQPTAPSPASPEPQPVPTSVPVASEPAQTLTFTLVGGTTAISFSPSGVQVLWATPNPGFDVEIEPESPGFKVEFEADHHESRIEVWWSGGPQHDIREKPDN